MATQYLPKNEKPKNGIAGLKHIRHDILSGIVVSLVSLPLSSGIAIASGAPPIVGLISAILAGLIFPFIGGAYMTIAGPAAGLAPALLAVMTHLGGAGDAEHLGEGYPFVLCVICMVGILQTILVLLRLAKFAAIIPISVVEGMLASIGLLIIVKQIPMFLGYTGKVHAHEFYQFITETPTFLSGAAPLVIALSVSTLGLLFALSALQKKFALLRIIPPQLLAVVFAVIFAQFANLRQLNPAFLISIPGSLFDNIHTPNFAELFQRTELWYAAIVGVITLTMIDGVESLATAMAVDRIDPFKRRSNPNRVLLAMGISNIASSMVGGLTIIPGGVKSKANIAAGGRTLWANFTNAICLIIYLVFAKDLIMMIPKGALAAVLIFTGWKMCEPAVWRHMASVGKEQLAVFAVTIVSTLATDLLWGIGIGTGMTLALNFTLSRFASVSSVRSLKQLPTLTKSFTSLFTNPVVQYEVHPKEYRLVLGRTVNCFNSYLLADEISKAPAEAETISIQILTEAGLVDHTACENLMYEVEESKHGKAPVQLTGLENFTKFSTHHDKCSYAAFPL